MTIPLGIMASSRVAAGGSLAPDDLADLTLWLKADAITGLSDGDPVTTWPDSGPAGNDATQGTASEKPTYQTGEINGLPVVRFDGVNDWLASAASASGVEQTLFAVVKFALTDVSGTLRGPSASGGLQWTFNGDGWYGLIRAQIAGISGDFTTFTSGYHYLSARWSDTEDLGATWRDGSTWTSTTHTASLSAGTTTQIGRAFSDAGESLGGDLAELISYDAALSTSDRQAIEAYLAAKYGL